MSRSLLGGVAERDRVVDEPLDLPGVEPAFEGRHRALAFGDALADRRAVAPQSHGRGEEVGVRVEFQRARDSLPAVAMAAAAIGVIELGSRQVFPPATGTERGERREENERVRLQGVRQAGRRWTIVAVAWSRGRTTISSMLTWDGRVAAQTTQSATSPAVSGSRPR